MSVDALTLAGNLMDYFDRYRQDLYNGGGTDAEIGSRLKKQVLRVFAICANTPVYQHMQAYLDNLSNEADQLLRRTPPMAASLDITADSQQLRAQLTHMGEDIANQLATMTRKEDAVTYLQKELSGINAVMEVRDDVQDAFPGQLQVLLVDLESK